MPPEYLRTEVGSIDTSEIVHSMQSGNDLRDINR